MERPTQAPHEMSGPDVRCFYSSSGGSCPASRMCLARWL